MVGDITFGYIGYLLFFTDDRGKRMSESPENEPPKVIDVAHCILDALKAKFGKRIDLDSLRLGLGLCMSSSFSTYLSEAKTKAEQERLVAAFHDTMGRFCENFEYSCSSNNIDSKMHFTPLSEGSEIIQ